jgi:hypothetical protein
MTNLLSSLTFEEWDNLSINRITEGLFVGKIASLPLSSALTYAYNIETQKSWADACKN